MDMKETFQELFSTLSKGSDFDPPFILGERDRTNERGLICIKRMYFCAWIHLYCQARK